MIARLFMQNCTYHMKMLNKVLVSEGASLNPYSLSIKSHFLMQNRAVNKYLHTFNTVEDIYFQFP